MAAPAAEAGNTDGGGGVASTGVAGVGVFVEQQARGSAQREDMVEFKHILRCAVQALLVWLHFLHRHHPEQKSILAMKNGVVTVTQTGPEPRLYHR